MFDLSKTPARKLPQPKIEAVPFRHAVQLIEPFHFQHYFIPAGRIWDGQTTWPFWVIAGSPFDPLALVPSLIHDELYKRGTYFDINGDGHPMSRKRADAVFYDLCLLYGVPKWQCLLKFYGLWIGGWYAFNKYRSGSWTLDELGNNV